MQYPKNPNLIIRQTKIKSIYSTKTIQYMKSIYNLYEVIQASSMQSKDTKYMNINT